MAWFGGPTRDESALRAILREVITPLSMKVDGVDGKIDRAITELRRELGDAVREMGQQYMRVDIANQRFAELTKRIENTESDIKTLQDAPGQQSQTTWMRWGVVASIILGLLGAIISVVNLLVHLSYHP